MCFIKIHILFAELDLVGKLRDFPQLLRKSALIKPLDTASLILLRNTERTLNIIKYFIRKIYDESILD